MILGFAIEQLQKMQDLLRDRFFVVPEKALQVEQHVDVRWLEQSSIDQVAKALLSERRCAHVRRVHPRPLKLPASLTILVQDMKELRAQLGYDT